MKNFILQAVTEQNHISAINELLSATDSEDIIFSSAFMTEAGLSVLEESLKPVAAKATVFAGIRNGITTAQGLERALTIGCKVMAVDTGSRLRIFHPKLYFSRSAAEACLIIGSANLTLGGLNSNIEASLCQSLALSDTDDAALADQVSQKFAAMIADYPEHVFQIENTDQIDDLLVTGRVIDEGVTRRPEASGASADREGDQLPRMKLKTPPIRSKKSAKKVVAKLQPATAPITDSGKAVRSPDSGLELVWESSPLVRRDLDIPLASGTNLTGSMLLKKGNSDIDQQTYFRASVFNDLDWKPDDRTAGKELAEADFQIIIRGVDYGVHTLTVTNDTRTNTRSYEQKQPMSAIRWGEARPLIAKSDLLERTMLIYKDDSEDGLFVIAID